MSENTTPAGETAVPEVHTVDSILATIGYDGFVRALFNRSGDFSKDFAHAVLGISTEVYELRHANDKVNQTEEAGDLSFYAHALVQVVEDYLTSKGQELDCQKLEEAIQRLEYVRVDYVSVYTEGLLNLLLDDAKRWVGYGRAPSDFVGSLSRGLYAASFGVWDCGVFDEDDQIKRTNIAKLLERYKGLKFTSEAAINRDVVAERSVMEHAGA